MTLYVQMATISEPSASNDMIPDDIQQRYSNWKKNTKLLYDYLNTNATKWPSLTCQFFPDLDTSTDLHRILFSSFTSSQLPEDESIYISSISTLKHLSWSSLNNFDMDEMEFKPDNSTKFPPKNLTNDIVIRFPNGDCNRARYLPQNPDVISAASSDGSIYIFDRTKHGTTSISQSTNLKPYEIQLLTSSPQNKGKETVNVDSNNEAVSLAWNLQREGILASCYSQGQVKVWDVSQYTRSSPTIDTPLFSIDDFDPQGSNDVSWMPFHDSLFAACGESNILAVYDLRTSKQIAKTRQKLHSGGINSCKFNSHNELLLASADGDGKMQMWDIRKLDDEPIQSIDHGSSISTIEWNPNLETIIATAGQNDGLVKLWDASSGDLIFVHGGHMLGVNDIGWNSHDPWLMCSVSNDNSIHLWKPAQHLVDPQK